MDRDIHVVRLIGAVADLTALLKDQGVPGAFIGGLAANLLGRPRITKDVDAVVLLGNLHLESFLAAGVRFGFVPRIRRNEFRGEESGLASHPRAE